jgi:acyl carrier protein
VEFLGRIDDQVKLRGYRVELGEISAMLREAPGVRDAVVLLREDTPGDPRLVGYVAGEGMPSTAQLRERLTARLPSHMVPAVLVALPALPLTPNGKVDRRALPAPDAAAAAGGPAKLPPRTGLEKQLAEIWRDVLELSAGSLGVEDDFFALGGHSILAIQVVARVREELGAELAIRGIFDHPTVAKLAAYLQASFPQLKVDELSDADVEALLLQQLATKS